MSNDYLLIGWMEIWKELFHDKEGNPVIALDTLQRKYGKDMQDKGVIWDWTLGAGKGRRLHNIIGWKNIIQNYFIRKAQRKKEG
jgi:hypothetical protein